MGGALHCVSGPRMYLAQIMSLIPYYSESVTSSASLSSAASTNIATPMNTAFDLARTSLSDDSHSHDNTTTGLSKSKLTNNTAQQQCKTTSKIGSNGTAEYPGISSLIVELSSAGNSSESSSDGNINVSNILAGIDDSVRQVSQAEGKQDKTRTPCRTPSKRASQVFSFLNEKRPKRLSNASIPLPVNSQAMGSTLNLSTAQIQSQPQHRAQQALDTEERDNIIHARPLPVPSPAPSRMRPITPTIDTNIRSSTMYMQPSQTASSASFRPLPIPRATAEHADRLDVIDAYPSQGPYERAPTPDVPIETCLDHDMPLPSPWAEPDEAFPDPPLSPIPSPIIPPAVLAPIPTQIPLPASRARTPVPLTASNNAPVVWTTADKAIAAHEQAEGRARERVKREREREEMTKRERREATISLPSQKMTSLGLPTPVSAHSHRLQHLRSPAPAPPSPVAFYPLNPPPRPNVRSRTGSNSSSIAPSHRVPSVRGKAHSTDVVDVVARGRTATAHARGGSESNARLSVWETAQGRGRSPSPNSRPLPVPPAQRGHAHTQSASVIEYAPLRERTNSEKEMSRQRVWQHPHAPSSYGGRPALPGKRSISPTLLAGSYSSKTGKRDAETWEQLEKENGLEVECEKRTEKGDSDVNAFLSVGRSDLGRKYLSCHNAERMADYGSSQALSREGVLNLYSSCQLQFHLLLLQISFLFLDLR